MFTFMKAFLNKSRNTICNFSSFFEIIKDREALKKSRGYFYQVRFSGKSRTKRKFIIIESAKMMLKLCRIVCSRHECISLSPAFDRYTS